MSEAIKYTMVNPSANDVTDAITERLNQIDALLSVMISEDNLSRMSKEVQTNSLWAVQSLASDVSRLYEHQRKMSKAGGES